MGMSGGPQDKTALLKELVAADDLIVTHDGQTALSGAMSGGPGMIVIAGTGSFAFGRERFGRHGAGGRMGLCIR